MSGEAPDVGQDRSSATRPRDRSRRRGRDTSDAQNARRHIVDSAIACILELGFYRASSNEIARQANVSWGSIQYHFGSREALMLAVVEELNQRFVTTVNRARISGDTLEERLGSLYDVLAEQYGAPTYLARLQIILNLSHDPDTSADVVATLVRLADAVGEQVRRLLRDALGEEVSPETMSVIFNSIRGTALSRQITDAVPLNAGGDRTPTIDPRERSILIAGLAGAASLESRTRA